MSGRNDLRRLSILVICISHNPNDETLDDAHAEFTNHTDQIVLKQFWLERTGFLNQFRGSHMRSADNLGDHLEERINHERGSVLAAVIIWPDCFPAFSKSTLIHHY